MLYKKKEYSKAETLQLIKSKLKKSIKISNLYFFDKKKYLLNKTKIINNIYSKFNTKVIIRSSSKKEDNLNFSNAGKYLSILNIDPKNKTAKKQIARIDKMNTNNSSNIVYKKGF